MAACQVGVDEMGAEHVCISAQDVHRKKISLWHAQGCPGYGRLGVFADDTN